MSGQLILRCKAGVERATGRNHPTQTCEGTPVILIVTEDEIWHAGDVQEWLLIAFPVCAEHAPEEVHEMRSSAGEAEFAVVTIGGE